MVPAIFVAADVSPLRANGQPFRADSRRLPQPTTAGSLLLGGLFLGLLLLSLITESRAASGVVADSREKFILRAEQQWQLNPPNGERFDASGLLLQTNGTLLTVNDRGPGLYAIRFGASSNSADLILLTNVFTPAQLAPFASAKIGRWDWEGIAQDRQGRFYLCEEANRWIVRADPASGRCERLNIDWQPVAKYFASDPNASFEGVAVGGGKLFVANERQRGRIIVVDLETLAVVRSFQVDYSGSAARDTHYSDLCWHHGVLWVLLRESGVVLKVDPARERVVAEFSFREMERGKEVVYQNPFPTSTMEGLAVDDEFLWLVTDNNGAGRWAAPEDIRPTLFKCRRPDR